MVNYNSYAEDVQRYLVSKFPNEDASTLLEVSEYIGYRTTRLIYEVIEDRDKEWKRMTEKYYTHISKRKENNNDT